MTNNTAAVRTGKIKVRKMTDEVVFIPSVQFPGTTFQGVTSPDIRQRNLQRYKYTQGLYRDRKAEERKSPAQITAEAVKAALATAQGGSLVHRSLRKEAA